MVQPPFDVWDKARQARLKGWPDLFAVGSVPDEDWREKHGLAVTARLPSHWAARLAGISETVWQTLGASVRYGPDGVHVTLLTMPWPSSELLARHGPGLVDQILGALNDCVERAIAEWAKRGEPADVTFTGLVANRSTLVMAADPSKSLYRLRCLIVENALRHPLLSKLEVKGSWGSHITLSRILVALAAGSDRLESLQAKLAAAATKLALGTGCALEEVEVSAMHCSGGRFRLEVSQRHSLVRRP